MRFMILVKATRDSEAGRQPSERLFAEMAAYHEALAKAGVLLDGSGLQPSSKGWRVRYAGDKRTIVDCPLAEAKELFAGYTMIQTKTRTFARSMVFGPLGQSLEPIPVMRRPATRSLSQTASIGADAAWSTFQISMPSTSGMSCSQEQPAQVETG